MCCVVLTCEPCVQEQTLTTGWRTSARQVSGRGAGSPAPNHWHQAPLPAPHQRGAATARSMLPAAMDSLPTATPAAAAGLVLRWPRMDRQVRPPPRLREGPRAALPTASASPHTLMPAGHSQQTQQHPSSGDGPTATTLQHGTAESASSKALGLQVSLCNFHSRWYRWRLRRAGPAGSPFRVL